MKQKILIVRCDDYDPKRLAAIIKEGMEELGVNPAGKVMLKPNCVVAHPEVFPHAFTRKEFVEAAAVACRQKSDQISELAIGERSGITIPTRFCFKKAGYNELIKKHAIKAYYFDETPHVPVTLKHPDRLRDLIHVPKPIAECDFLINLPKFKAHPWTRLTLSLKNLIGIQDDRHRLVDHNTFLEHKIVDLQEVIQPKFIAVDGIIAGQKMMLTPTPFFMGAVVMGTNSCAVDTVCCHMVNVDPNDLVHLRFASHRGFGPMDLDEIDVCGDFPLDEVRHRTRDFEFCMERIDNYFSSNGNLTCSVGRFPEAHSPDYCWGGCPGALQEAMHIFKQYYPDVQNKMKKVRYVVGKFDGPLNLEKGERVIFAGDCTSWSGEIDGKQVKLDSSYISRDKIDATKTKSNDMILKILGPVLRCFWNRSSRHIHATGCPVSVGAHVNYLSAVGKIKNVNFDPRNVFAVNIAYWQMRFHRFLNKFLG